MYCSLKKGGIMPLREFECPHCGEKYEKLLLKNDRQFPYFCEICRCELSQLMSGCSFRLEGDGWADDGYSKKK